MTDNKKQENKFEAAGKVIYLGVDRMGHKSMTLVMKGSSKEQKRVTINCDDAILSDIKYGNHVKVKGYFNAFSYFNEARKKESNIQVCVATSVEKDISDLDKVFGKPGKYYSDSYFKIYISGEITDLKETGHKSWAKMEVKTGRGSYDDRNSFISLSYHKNMKFMPAFSSFKVGEQVYIAASMYTPSKEFNGEQVYFEDLIIEDIYREHMRSTADEPVEAEVEEDELEGLTRFASDN